jgi:hypothetical protein
MAASYDVSTGRATVGDVMMDMGIFIEGWITELIDGPTTTPNSKRRMPMRFSRC